MTQTHHHHLSSVLLGGALVAFVGAGACTPQADKKLTVVVASLPLRDGTGEGAKVLATARLGSPLKGGAPGVFGDKNHWVIRLNDGRTAYVPMDTAAEIPAFTTTAHFVAVPEAVRLKEPYARGQILERLAFGSKVDVLSNVPVSLPGFGFSVVDGRITGFVLMDQLSATAPTLETALDKTRQALLDGRFSDAAVWARAAAGLDETNAPVQGLAAAVLRAVGAPDSGNYRRRAPEQKVVMPKADPDLKPGVLAVVSVPRLPARKGPTATAKVVTWLALNTPVAVRGHDGKWARVAWKGHPNPQSLVVDPFAPPPESPPASPPPRKKASGGSKPPETELYVPAGLLGPSPVDKKTLRVTIKDALANNAYAEAVLALEQLLALDPADATAAKDLVGAAFSAGQYELAVQAALRVAGAPAVLMGLDVEELEWLQGCRGDPAQASVTVPSDEELQKGKPRSHACVRELDLEPPCAACEAGDTGTDVGMFDRDMMVFVDGERARVLALQDTVNAAVKAHGERLAAVDKHYPQRGVCHARLRNRATTSSAEGQKMVVAHVAGEEVRSAVVALPAVGGQQTLDVYFKMPATPGSRCLLVNARNADAVKKALLERFKNAESKLPPLREVTLARRACMCLGN